MCNYLSTPNQSGSVILGKSEGVSNVLVLQDISTSISLVTNLHQEVYHKISEKRIQHVLVV